MNELPIEGSYNARTITRDDERVWLVRSAALDGLTPKGEQALREAGVDLIIDLRETSEHTPHTHHLPIIEMPLYREAPPTSGTLEGIYLGLLRERGHELANAVALIANHPGVGVVHCTAGKDRTGLVVALARLVAGESREAVVADYALSGRAVRPARATIAERQLAELVLTDHERAHAERLHLDSPAEALMQAIHYVDEHGGPADYLVRHGLTEAHIEAIIAKAGLINRTPATVRAEAGQA